MVDRDLEGINDFDKSTRNKFSEQKNGIQKANFMKMQPRNPSLKTK